MGFLSGTILRKSEKDTSATSANITVVDNNQVITADQGTPTITRTSTITVKDADANYGYTLSAKLSAATANSIPGATITIYPTVAPTTLATSTCTQSSPCILPVDDGSGTTTPKDIYMAYGTVSNPNAAITANGATTEFTVTITLPQNTPLGNYIVDVAYSEEPYVPPCPVLQGKTYMQEITPPTNSTYGNDTRVVLKDRRNNQDYYVQNIVNQDGSCLAWMETNLRYGGGGDNTYGDAVTLGYVLSGPASNTYAEYMDPGGSTTLDVANPQNNTQFYGYLYNWCAAMGGQFDECDQTFFAVCPLGWRLPKGEVSGASDFDKLRHAVSSDPSSSHQGLIDDFLAVYSGGYYYGLGGQGISVSYWSSTEATDTRVYGLYIESGGNVGDSTMLKDGGEAVRCVFDAGWS